MFLKGYPLEANPDYLHGMVAVQESAPWIANHKAHNSLRNYCDASPYHKMVIFGGSCVPIISLPKIISRAIYPHIATITTNRQTGGFTETAGQGIKPLLDAGNPSPSCAVKTLSLKETYCPLIVCLLAITIFSRLQAC